MHQTLEQTNEAGIANSSARVLPPGTVALSRTASVGFVTILGREMATSQDFVNWICGPHLDPLFLSQLFRRARAFIRSLSSGATHKTVYVPTVKAFFVCVPPVDEQRRLALTLEDQFAIVAGARAAAEARLEAASQLAGAYRRAMLEGGVSWPRVPLKDLLASPLRTGISKPQLAGSEVKCLTLSAVRPGGSLDLSCSKPVDLREESADSSWVKPRAFYVVRGNGNLSLVGRAGQAPDRIDSRVAFPDLLIEMIPSADAVWPPFLRVIWDSHEVRSQIEERARTSAGIHKINLANLGQVKLPVPTLEQQKQAASDFGTRLEGFTDVLRGAADAKAAVTALPAALLRRAFHGEL